MFLSVASLSQRAAGRSCDARAAPWIRFEGPRTPTPSVPLSEVLRRVRAELAHKSLSACMTGKGEPIAVVQITPVSPDAVEVVVTVSDSLTAKRVSRTLDLRSIPADARPLAIAVGTDELLMASWVEVSLESSAARVEPPTAITHALSEKLARHPVVEASAAGAFDWYQGGQRFAGLDVRGGVWFAPRFATTLRLGLRWGPVQRSSSGTVDAEAKLVGVGARIALSPPARRLRVEALGRLDMLFVAYTPLPEPGALGHPSSAIAAAAAGGLALRYHPTAALRLGLEGTLGVPFVPVTATDGGSEVSAIRDLAVSAGGELGIAF